MSRLAMPQLGESVTEGTIIKWLKNPGEHIGLDEPLVEIETEKVNVEVPSPWEGTLTEILVPEGETVAVGTDLASIEESTGDRLQGTGDRGQGTGDRGQRATGNEQRGEETPPTSAHPEPVEGLTPPARPQSSPDGARARYSPAVMHLAEEHNLDLRALTGSGLGGRVTRKDVMNVLAQRSSAPAETAAEQPALAAIQESAETPTRAGRPPLVQEARVAPPPAPPVAQARAAEPPSPDAGARFVAPSPEAAPVSQVAEDEETIHPSPTRRAIAQHMVRSVQTSPHAWMVVEVDLTRLVRFRDSIKAEFRARGGIDLSYLPFMIKATVLALRENPRLNSTWRDGDIVLKRRINIGIAVNTNEGLMVPVIHDADNYSIAGLARVGADLAARARSRRLKLEEVQGGTFTVDNTGVFGSVVSAPIINQPQAAIVTMEAIVKRPVVVDDAIAIRSMMNSCISFDHRVVDGGEIGPFMQSLKRHLESFGPETALY